MSDIQRIREILANGIRKQMMLTAPFSVRLSLGEEDSSFTINQYAEKMRTDAEFFHKEISDWLSLIRSERKTRWNEMWIEVLMYALGEIDNGWNIEDFESRVAEWVGAFEKNRYLYGRIMSAWANQYFRYCRLNVSDSTEAQLFEQFVDEFSDHGLAEGIPPVEDFKNYLISVIGIKL